jgi:hypothetical protein
VSRAEVFFVSLVLVAALTGCAPVASPTPSAMPSGSESAAASPTATVEGTAPTAEALLGIWLLQLGDTLMRLSADGTFVINNGEPLAVDPDRTGTYSIEGMTMRFVQEAKADCPGGSVDVWTVGLLEDGLLRGMIIESPCPPGPGAHGDWVRVSPDSVLERDVTPGIGSPTVASAGNIIGHVWIVDGTSTLLSLYDDGTYAWDDRGLLDTRPADAGRWELNGQSLSLISGTASEICADGDSVVVADGQVFVPADASYLRFWRATATADPCHRLEGEVTLTLVA